MGGTHIDAVIMKDGKVINWVKNETNQEDIFQSIWETLKDLLSNYDKSQIKRINLSTTVSTNAIVENKTSPVGMIIQSGPGIANNFLACGQEDVFISGYIDHRGKIVEFLKKEEIEKAIDLFKEKNIGSCAIVTKFSTRNPSHEMKIKELIEEDFKNITMGHRLSGSLNFPRRVYTSYLNSAVYNTFHNFSNNIKKSMEMEEINCPLFILKADGGTMNLEIAEERPVETILSGPAASFMGINAMLNTDQDAIFLDIGGTTTDIFFLADGVPLFEPLGIKIDDYKTLVRSIYSVSIGLGGDSAIKVVDGDIVIGPDRIDSPYALGGSHATPTDAMIVLELMDAGDKNKAYEAMETLARPISLTPIELAEKILNMMANTIKNNVDKLLYSINSQLVYTVKELLADKKLEPKSINIIGGPAKILAPYLEKEFNLSCHCPKDYPIANAIGAALAKVTTDITMLADTSQGILTVPELGIYETIGHGFTLGMAKERALKLLVDKAKSLGAIDKEIEAEITEESVFNMVEGFYTTGQNIRIKAQIRPGLSQKFRGDLND